MVLVCGVVFVARPAAAVDYTDLWWNSAESGWGVNMIQADDFIFATFFIYGPSTQPVWYTGQMTRDANGVFTGPLFLTSGSYFAAQWDPTQRSIAQVGTVTFTPSSGTNGTLTYNVGAAVVSKFVTRQTLKTIPLGGAYMGALVADVFNCANPSENQTNRRFHDLDVAQTTGGILQLDFAVQGTGRCVFSGAYSQAGQLYRIDGATYSCGAGPATVFEIKATAEGIEGRWSAPLAGGCTEAGSFSAVLK